MHILKFIFVSSYVVLKGISNKFSVELKFSSMFETDPAVSSESIFFPLMKEIHVVSRIGITGLLSGAVPRKFHAVSRMHEGPQDYLLLSMEMLLWIPYFVFQLWCFYSKYLEDNKEPAK